MGLLLLYSVLVDFTFELHAWQDLLCVDLEVFELLNYAGVLFFLRKTHQLIVESNVFKSSQELGCFFL